MHFKLRAGSREPRAGSRLTFNGSRSKAVSHVGYFLIFLGAATMGLADLPQSKWGGGTGRQVILKADFDSIERAIIEAFELNYPPDLVWIDAVRVQVPSTADCRARIMMSGFPSPLHTGQMVDGSLADGRYRENSSEAVMDFGVPARFWGNEKANQWYCVYAIAGASDTSFTLKAMPVMRYASQVAQTITLRNNGDSADIGYGLISNELQSCKILVLSGASKGLVRPIIANNSDNGSGGTLTYSGSVLTMARGDWLIVLPNTNFRYLGMIFNDSSSNLLPFMKNKNSVAWGSRRLIVSGAINGYQLLDLSYYVPPLAKRLHGLATATNGYDVKAALSYDGVEPTVLVHLSPPATDFIGSRGAGQFDCQLLDGNNLYLSNENTAQQLFWAVGWEE